MQGGIPVANSVLVAGTAFVRAPPPPTVVPSVWDTPQFWRASIQDVASFVGRPAVTPQGSTLAWDTPRLAITSLPGETTVFVKQPPVQAATAAWWGGFIEVRFAQPLNAAQQQWSNFQPQGFIRSNQPDGWRIDRFDFSFTAPFPVGLQQFYPHVARGIIPTAATPHGWEGQQLSVVYSTPTPSDEQQWLGSVPEQISSPATPRGYWSSSEAKFAVPLNAAQQQYFSPLPQGPPKPIVAAASFDAMVLLPVVVEDTSTFVGKRLVDPAPPPKWGWAGVGGVVVVNDTVRIAGQPGRLSKTTSSPSNTTTQGWFGDHPDLFILPFPAAAQQFFANGLPLGNFTTSGWFNYALDYAFAKQVPTTVQQWTGFNPRGFIAQVFPQGFFPPSPEAIAQPVSPSRQQFEVYFRSVPSLNQSGWQTTLDVRFTPPRPVDNTSYPLRTLSTQSNTVAGWRQQPLNPEVIRKPFPVEQQPFDGIGRPPQQSLIILPPAGGGHRKKPKSVQPIWDRKPEAPAAAEAAPEATAPGHVTERFKGELPLPFKAPAAQVPAIVRASGVLRERGDTLRGSGRWNDDEIALKLLDEAHRQDIETAKQLLKKLAASDPEEAAHYQALLDALEGGSTKH